ncbi:MAG TPA: alpha/beta hydrolase-fold protein [Pyrinomonadaceae bacterium]|jgi:predicted alpha/beta superfamily hydrolase|nr:alpha/beta hydrolase-fold protein [Pyrinomonadaceae bacterium]
MNKNTSSVIRLLFGFAILLMIATAANAQPPTGTVKKIAIKSAVLGEERVILVRTPPGYETNKLTYPVLYMTDGDAHMGHTSSTIEFLTQNGRIPELIVVGITNTDRTRDLTPVKSSNKNAAGQLQFPTSGGADNFLKFIQTELIPEIEKNYRVQPYRILAGHSLGGLFAIHTMISKPGMFNSYIAVSPSLQWENGEALQRATDFLKNQKEFRVTLFVSLGNEPGAIGDSFESFRDALSKSKIKDFEWQAERMDDEDHGSVVLRSHYFGLRKVYEGWQGLRDPKSGAVTGGLKGADEHYKKLSEKFGYSIPVPENLINQMGYQFLFDGKPDEAIAAFKANVERYPASANVYDSLAEAYERGGKIDLAEPLYDKARALGEQNKDPNAAIYKANFERAHAKLLETSKKP